MFRTYETVVYCQQPQPVLEQIMEEAVDWYLSLRPKAFPLERQRSYVTLKVQQSYRSNGELVTVLVGDRSFTIISKCLDESTQLLAWSKNRENVVCLSACFKNQIDNWLCSAA